MSELCLEMEHYPTTRPDDVAEAAHMDGRFRDSFRLDEDLKKLVAAAPDAVADAVPVLPDVTASDALDGTTVKTIHLIRHGQGVHNVITDCWSEVKRLGGKTHHAAQALWGQDPDRKGPSAPGSTYAPLFDAMIDAPLTEKGVGEAVMAREQADAAGAAVDLLVVSPMRRAAVTGMTAFPKAKRPIAHDSLHERSGLYIWDKRRKLQELKNDPVLSTVDWSLIDTESSPCWHDDRRESPAEIAERLVAFMRWLRARPEKEIAVASHSAVLFCLLQSGLFKVTETNNLTAHGTKADSWFITGELRSFQVTWAK